MNSEPSLSVVICAYTVDRWNELRAAIASVRAQRRPADDILLVVDHCPELRALAGRSLPGIRVLPNLQRKGLSGARNTGVEAALGDALTTLRGRRPNLPALRHESRFDPRG